MRRLETHDWWPELVDMKDALSLRELAERFGVTPGAISAAFKRSGITRRSAPPGPRALRKRRSDELPPEAGAQWDGAATDDAPNVRPGSKDQQITRFLDLLGEVPDAEVARKAGVSVRTIASYRARHAIGAYTGPRRNSRGTGRRQSKIDPYRELLGQVPDRVVAEKASVSLNAVRNYRVKYGIAAARRGAAPAQTAYSNASVQRGVQTPSGDSAWRVRFVAEDGPVERVIIAGSVVDAAAHATVAKLGHVVEITWIAEIL